VLITMKCPRSRPPENTKEAARRAVFHQHHSSTGFIVRALTLIGKARFPSRGHPECPSPTTNGPTSRPALRANIVPLVPPVALQCPLRPRRIRVSSVISSFPVHSETINARCHID
jgi:hypothetical protein